MDELESAQLGSFVWGWVWAFVTYICYVNDAGLWTLLPAVFVVKFIVIHNAIGRILNDD